jgi:hypothetical protein
MAERRIHPLAGKAPSSLERRGLTLFISRHLAVTGMAQHLTISLDRTHQYLGIV